MMFGGSDIGTLREKGASSSTCQPPPPPPLQPSSKAPARLLLPLPEVSRLPASEDSRSADEAEEIEIVVVEEAAEEASEEKTEE